ncbi:molecular chaperone [Symbiopectobacterium purcellii]|uniref:Molecular chaperone n=1 Tax=Symbiopectobacterium purcellii TaxID=2871826 RepID=A0ABX9ANW3_9ENTR|nr:molecular chaperone [Symbiopectobacterium purcellii]QZN96702.1 molecular chaperone [Symbiopectobacterium purcellii]
MSAKKDMLSRLSNVAKNAPLQESAATKTEDVTATDREVSPVESVKKAKPARKAKNLQIPEDLWDAYEVLKSNNTTSLLMTGYILEAFREKLAKDGAFNKS